MPKSGYLCRLPELPKGNSKERCAVVFDRLIKWCAWLLLVGGLLYISGPVYTLFDVVIIPKAYELHKANAYANSYLIFRFCAGLSMTLIGMTLLYIQHCRTRVDALREAARMVQALKAENEALKARVAELGKAPQKAAQGANKSHAGSETASAKRLAEWKEAYIPAMVKAAIELGAEGPKPERERKQRKDIGALLDRFAVQGKAHPSDCPEAVDVFRASLPDGYVNTTGGAPKSRANKINQ